MTWPAPGVADVSPSVPGDPGTVAGVALRMAVAADGMATAARGLPLDLPAGWQGLAAGAFLRLIGSQAERLDTAAAAWRQASSALSAYARALDEAQALAARATALAGADPHRAAVLTARAHESARSRAARAAAVIDDAAGRAPRRPGVLTRLWRASEDWRAEVGLGADESLESLVGLALRLAPFRALGDPGGFAVDARAVAGGVLHELAHPGDLVRGLLDWDTWVRNPARAVGHLAPDAVAAVASGGSVTAARRSLAAVAHSARQQVLRDTAGVARERFVDGAQPAFRDEELVAWREDSGLALDPDANSAVSAYWRAASDAEPAVTRRIRALADEVGARLAGIEHRVKDVESLRRKLADRLLADDGAFAPGPEPDRPGRRVLHLLAEQGDTLRYTLVIDDRRYASAVSDAAARLDEAAMSLTSFRNTWQGMRYRGINTTWTDPGTGVRFEVQFHTPATWRATVLTHPWYEIYRRPDTQPAVREQLGARIAAVYAEASLPRRTVRLTPDSMPPLPDPPPAAVDAAVDAAAVDAAAGVAAAGLAGTGAHRPRPGARLTRRGR